MDHKQSFLHVAAIDMQLIKTYLTTTCLLWIPIGIFMNTLQGALFFSLCTVSTACLFGSTMQLATAQEVSGNFQTLCLTFPVSRKSIQAGHFLAVLIATCIGFATGIISALISQVVLCAKGTPEVIYGFYGEFQFSLMLLAAILVIGLILLISIAQFGFSKGLLRYFPIIVVFVSFLIAPLCMPDGPFGTLFIDAFVRLMGDDTYRLIVAISSISISLILYLLAAIIAGMLYKKRQF